MKRVPFVRRLIALTLSLCAVVSFMAPTLAHTAHAASTAHAAHATAGSITEFAIPTPGSTATAITFGPDGNLWFTENIANKIGRITSKGVITEFSTPTAGSAPFGITIGPDGNLWFTESAANQIGRITTH